MSLSLETLVTKQGAMKQEDPRLLGKMGTF